MGVRGPGEPNTVPDARLSPYGESEVVPGAEDCCEMLFEGQSLRAEHCPDAITDLVEELTGAPALVPLEPDPDGSGDTPVTH